MRPADAVRAAAAARAAGRELQADYAGRAVQAADPHEADECAQCPFAHSAPRSTAALPGNPAQHGTCIAQGGRGIDRTFSDPHHARGPSGLRRTRASQCTERIAECRGAAGR